MLPRRTLFEIEILFASAVGFLITVETTPQKDVCAT